MAVFYKGNPGADVRGPCKAEDPRVNLANIKKPDFRAGTQPWDSRM